MESPSTSNPNTPTRRRQNSVNSIVPVIEEQLQEGSCQKPTPQKLYSLRILGRVAEAVQNFKAALNPTYTPGKRARPSSSSCSSTSEGTCAVTVRPLLKQQSADTATFTRTSNSKLQSTSMSLVRSLSGRASSGRPVQPGKQHGSKASLLFRGLPQAEASKQ